ncbi:hypothetical protein EDC04DRAFT_2522155, partial [Pisolithus marmoratus]
DILPPVSGEIATTMILAHAQYIHVRKDVLNERGVIDITKHTAIARFGNGRLGDVFRLLGLVWEQEQGKIEQ